MLAKHIGKLCCNFTEDDEKFIDMFWDPVFNSSWIYLSDEIVVELMGYKKSKDTMRELYRKLLQEYDCDTDYKQVDKDNRGAGLKNTISSLATL